MILDGRKLDDVTPISLDSIPTGEHTVEVTIYGRETKTATIEVFPQNNHHVTRSNSTGFPWAN